MCFLSFGNKAEIEPIAKFYGWKKSSKSLESLKLRAQLFEGRLALTRV